MSWKIYKSGSNSYNTQMKQLDSLCKWHKEKRIFVIDEVYSKPLVKQDNRRNKAIYVKPIKDVLLFNLYNRNIKEFVSITTIIKRIEVFNEDFYNNYNGELDVELEKDYVVSNYTLRNFKIGAFREVQRIVERALDSLKKQNIISYEPGRIIVTDEGVYRFAYCEELEIIEMLESEQLKLLKCKNMASMKLRGLEKKFYKEVKKRFVDMGLDYIDYMFYGYKILSYDREEAQLIDANEVENSIYELKILFKKRLNQFAKSTYEREVKREYANIILGEPLLERNFKAHSNYLLDFKCLLEFFIT
ncbi:hypothetical protein [Clostridium butyricum]|uniref:hypothetical protein n=1 Tax=Clostridium butyricum TaxID=1492 RepID=UPI00189F8056|nr:hypothetical protein [Clostridium butyricum]MDB2153818.1 hypothetical protein [Clostridium butyricum]